MRKVTLKQYPKGFKKLSMEDLHQWMISQSKANRGYRSRGSGTTVKLTAGKEREKYCKKHGLPWPEDKSNFTERFNRNVQ